MSHDLKSGESSHFQRRASSLNLILFERAETSVPLARTDARAIHLLQVLRRNEGDTFDAGIVDGPRGKGVLLEKTATSLRLGFTWGDMPPSSDALTLIVAMPRPQTARAILRDVSAMGAMALHFASTEKSDPNYTLSSLWQKGEWRRQVIAGAEQAFCTRLPDVTFGRTLIDVINALPVSSGNRVALDNYESPEPLSRMNFTAPAVCLAFGPERGWSAADRDFLRKNNFKLAHLGERVLRTETACIVAIALTKAKMGWV